MKKFRFPVVYADGRMVYEKLKGEKFVGVICGDVLITAQDASKKMDYVQALDFAKSMQFRGKQGRMFNSREVEFIFQNLDEVNEIFFAFSDEGAQPLSHECYWLMQGDNSRIADMGVRNVICGISCTGEYRVRPVFYCSTQFGKICFDRI